MDRSRAKGAAGSNEQTHEQRAGENDPEHTAEAYAAATQDIDHDPDFAPPGKNDDLDEGETARLGDDGAGAV